MSEKIIIIKDLTDNAMSPSAGDKLREKIEKIYKIDNNVIIILDFSNIELYATPFFNRSTGYFFLQLKNEEIYNSKFKLINLDDLGIETYEYSLQTARNLLQKKLTEENMDQILNNADEEE